MRVLQYQYNGRDVLHDVHFQIDGRLYRYGSDEQAKPSFEEAYKDLCTVASKLAGLEVRVRKVRFVRKDQSVLAVVDCRASAINGEMMRLVLPKFGWRITHVADGEGNLIKRELPVGADDDGIIALQALEVALEDYVEHGDGQQDLFQAVPVGDSSGITE